MCQMFSPGHLSFTNCEVFLLTMQVYKMCMYIFVYMYLYVFLHIYIHIQRIVMNMDIAMDRHRYRYRSISYVTSSFLTPMSNYLTLRLSPGTLLCPSGMEVKHLPIIFFFYINFHPFSLTLNSFGPTKHLQRT